MRDALSIMDKIVILPMVKLPALEHLKHPGCRLLFPSYKLHAATGLAVKRCCSDDIDRASFEGDLVLNGLAEFIRNLLVCKDEKQPG